MFISLLEEGNYRGYIGSYAGNAEDVDFGTGSGNGTGKLHLTIQASPKLTIASNGNVGIGNINPANKLDVSGDINFTGLLKMTGLPGTAGQVLTSKGAAAPVWQNAAFSDNIRFGLRFNGADNSVIPVSNIYYNLSPADITVALGANNISINQTGLYHFEGVYFGLVQGSGFTGAPEMTMFFQLTGNSNYGMNLSTWKQLTLRTNVINNWFHQDNFSIDLYITAPAQLQFGVQFLSSNTPSYSEGSVTLYGHRISL